MKNLFATLLLFLAFSQPANANDVWLEARASYIHPTGSRFNHIYNDDGSYGAKAAVTVWDDLAAWLTVEGYTMKGKSIGLGNGTTLSCIPLGLGLQYMLPCFPFSCIDLYLGAGVDWSFFSIRDHSPYVIQKIDRNAWGGRFLAGAILYATENFFFDVFVEYTLSRLNYSHGFTQGVYTSSADVSHINAGVGVGYTFDTCCW